MTSLTDVITGAARTPVSHSGQGQGSNRFETREGCKKKKDFQPDVKVTSCRNLYFYD